MIEAMKQALEIIKNMRSGYGDDYHTGKEWRAMEALRQAIEQAEKQAPVAYIDHVSGKPKFIDGYVVQTDYDIPLYTAPLKQAPVAWRKKVNGVWHYFDESTPFPFDDCEPLYEKN
jgi:hypothetical protein